MIHHPELERAMIAYLAAHPAATAAEGFRAFAAGLPDRIRWEGFRKMWHYVAARCNRRRAA